MNQLSIKTLVEIKEGKSQVGNLWIKHPDLQDEARLDILFGRFFDLAKSRKIKTESEKLEELDKKGIWTKKDEAALSRERLYLERLKETAAKIIEQQRKMFLEDVTKQENKISILEKRRSIALGRTAESYANKMANERFVLSLFFKDKSLKIPEIDEGEIEYLDDNQLFPYFTYYFTFKESLDDGKLKTLACSNYCQNLFDLAPDSIQFFGKNVLSLTSLQQRFLMFLVNYRNIMRSLVGRVSPEILSDWRELDKWAEANEKGRESIEQSWNKSNNSPLSYESIRASAEKAKNTTEEERVREMQKLLK